MSEEMGEGDGQPGVAQMSSGRAHWEGAQGLVRFYLTNPRYGRARQNVCIKFGGSDVQGEG